MNQPRIVINAHGGYVRDVFCSFDNAEVVLVDWDVEPGHAASDVVRVVRNGRVRNALVGCFNALPLESLPGTDVAAAIAQARQREGADAVHA